MSLRASPSSFAHKLAALPDGTRLRTIRPVDEDGWLEVEVLSGEMRGRTGYVSVKDVSGL
jgi:hypothetical protein